MNKFAKFMKKEVVAILGSLFGIIITALLSVIVIGGQSFIEDQRQKSTRQEILNTELIKGLQQALDNCANFGEKVKGVEAKVNANIKIDTEQNRKIHENEKKLIEHETILKRKQ
jgi:hypothetical protein